MDSEKFCLKWSDFENNISKAFRELKDDEDFFDVTLACDGNQLQAHKLILSACSPFFRSVLKKNPHQHPLLYLKGVKYEDIISLLNFMYHGEVNVAQEELSSFLAVAKDLQVKGLSASVQKQQPTSQSMPVAKRSLSEQSQSSNAILSNRSSKQQKISSRYTMSAGSSKDKDAEDFTPFVKTESIVVDVNCDPLLTSDLQLGQQSIDFPGEHDGYVYQQRYQLQMRHIKQMGHVSNTSQGWNLPETFSCQICEKSYSNARNLQLHMTSHKGMTYCSICDKNLSSPQYLRTHMAQLHQQQPV